MDGVIVDFETGIEKLDKKTKFKYAGRLDEVPGIFALMESKQGAIDAVKKLIKKYDVYILSTAPCKNFSAWSDKLEWIKKHFGEKLRKRLILSYNKHLNKGDYLIDDRLKNGAEKFEGELIHFGQKNFLTG